MEDLISVIVPVYNIEKYLHDSMESILYQTHKNLEIILVDDGSTDRSLSICKYYERLDNRVKVITQKNTGICGAFQKGLNVSKGKYVARHDGDDINTLDRYEKQLKYLKENNCQMVGCYIKGFGSGSEWYQKHMETLNIPIRNSTDQFYRAYGSKYINGGAVFGVSEVFKKLQPFNNDYGIVEDRLIYLTLHVNGCKIGLIEELLYFYRVHNTNSSLNSNSLNNLRKRNYELAFKYLFNEPISKYENIIIMDEINNLELMEHIFENKNATLVSEYQFNYFINNEVNTYNPENTVIFMCKPLYDLVYNYLHENGYEHLRNLFIIY